MRIIALKRLKDHWQLRGRSDSEQPLKSWYAVTREADWAHFADVKEQFGSASVVGERVVFNIAGNKYRLVAFINYEFHIVYIRFVGMHKEYDELDIENV
jgi:mRNA interferase HigB